MSKHVSTITSELKGRLLTVAMKYIKAYSCATITQLYLAVVNEKRPAGVGKATSTKLSRLIFEHQN